MKKQQFFHATAMLMLAILFSVTTTSCNSNDDDTAKQYCLDFVTFDGDIGTSATFSFRAQNDSPVINLVAPGTTIASANTGTGSPVLPGDRLVIYYTNDGHEPYTSGDITLYSVTRTISIPLEEGNIENYSSWKEQPISLEAVWRAGKYLNFSILHSYTSVPKVLKIVYSTPDVNGMCDAWVIYVAEGTMTVSSYALYACADISQIWNNGDCRGIRLHLCDSENYNGEKIVEFKKQ